MPLPPISSGITGLETATPVSRPREEGRPVGVLAEVVAEPARLPLVALGGDVGDREVLRPRPRAVEADGADPFEDRHVVTLLEAFPAAAVTRGM